MSIIYVRVNLLWGVHRCHLDILENSSDQQESEQEDLTLVMVQTHEKSKVLPLRRFDSHTETGILKVKICAMG